jgi:hypothetical protein
MIGTLERMIEKADENVYRIGILKRDRFLKEEISRLRNLERWCKGNPKEYKKDLINTEFLIRLLSAIQRKWDIRKTYDRWLKENLGYGIMRLTALLNNEIYLSVEDMATIKELENG